MTQLFNEAEIRGKIIKNAYIPASGRVKDREDSFVIEFTDNTYIIIGAYSSDGESEIAVANDPI